MLWKSRSVFALRLCWSCAVGFCVVSRLGVVSVFHILIIVFLLGFLVFCFALVFPVSTFLLRAPGSILTCTFNFYRGIIVIVTLVAVFLPSISIPHPRGLARFEPGVSGSSIIVLIHLIIVILIKLLFV